MNLWMLPLFLALADKAPAPELQTVAEKSDFRATARHAEVVRLCEALVKASPILRMGQLGTTTEGRMLPLLILADPPVRNAEEAAQSGKLVVLALGNIHAGEVCGKEALPMLARELGLTRGHPLLRSMIVVFAPIFNADGNERVSPSNRPGQVGPEEGMGQRTNAQGLDLNRDFTKLESPEVRALVRFLNRWDPDVVIDTHTTNGSYHRYLVTYDGPRHPATSPSLVGFVRDELLPEIGESFHRVTGQRAALYGNFAQRHTRWESYPAQLRYGIHYLGVRGHVGLLSEAYAYASYRDRVDATRDFVRACLESAARHAARIRAERQQAGRRASELRKMGVAVAIHGRLAKLEQPYVVAGYDEPAEPSLQNRRGKLDPATATPRDYPVELWAGYEPTISVRLPWAYVIPSRHRGVIENVQRHGIAVEELREDLEVEAEGYVVDEVRRSPAAFQRHKMTSVKVTPVKRTVRLRAGSAVVPVDQKLGILAAQLLEPQSEDGLCAWNFLDEALVAGGDYPILRLPHETTCLTAEPEPLPEDQKTGQPITWDVLYGEGPNVSFAGRPISGITWLDDGEHYLQPRSGQLHKVHARSGKSEPLFDPEPVIKALSAVKGMTAEAARNLVRRTSLRLDPQRKAAAFEHDRDLYYATLDGQVARRLTHTAGEEELAEFSPDGKFIAFVRASNLYVVDVQSGIEQALTRDGNGVVTNGKADWVYFEEIFNRNWKTYWWSPDSKHLAFLRLDDTPVPKYSVVDHIPVRQKVEVTAYPKAGDPNPLVKVGIVAVTGSAPVFVDWPEKDDVLISRVTWRPNGDEILFYLQDRAQTWLDVCTCPTTGGRPKRLFRETTQAWVDDLGEPRFLKDGSFLLASERTGWKHVYHYAANGQPIRPLTSGEWEARSIAGVDEEGGWVYVTGTRDSHIADNLYRVALADGRIERLTTEPGRHTVNLSPKGNLFVDTWSSHTTPTKVALRDSDGKLVRTLDTNPVRANNEFRRGRYELVQIRTKDGFRLEGSLLKPPSFHPSQKYPVWFMTYGGPHAPTISDSWGSGRGNDEMLAQQGILVFRCDPRSASGKGAASTWTCYRQLGVQELKDIEEAIDWLTQKPYVDATRIGMSGHSYGGFMTAYALTHSKKFIAGIAGAPVTDWHNYDTIYTERYMNTPAQNPKGYEVTSVVKAAANLHGTLLLLHGGIDDNVHVQNSLQLAHGLQQANKTFELMIYPTARHGIFGRHYQRITFEFIKRMLRVGDAAARPREAPSAKKAA